MSVSIFTGLAAALCYCLGTWQHWHSLRFRQHGAEAVPGPRSLIVPFCLAAMALHLVTVYAVMTTPDGLDLGLFSVASLVGLTVVSVVMLTYLTQPVANLLMLVAPLAALSVVVSLFLSSDYTPTNLPSPSHVLLALLAYSVLSIAAVQAIALWLQERQLRQTRSLDRLGIMPPIQVMENLLFQMLWLGLALLSIAIVTGFLYLDDMFAQRVAQHTVLSLTSWVVFGVLLWGRHTLGWRGRTAIRLTLAGFVLLALAYFGSKLVIEIILS